MPTLPQVPVFAQTNSTDFQQYQKALSDTSLQDAIGIVFQASFGSMKDYLSDRIRLSLKAHLPGLAPTDALAQIGIERGILRGPTEPDTAFAARLTAAWNAWPWAGTAYGVLSQLAAMGYPNVVLEIVHGLQYMINAAQTAPVVTNLPVGSWWIDANRAPAGVTAWAANTVYAGGASVVPSATQWMQGTSYPAGTVVMPTSSVAQTAYYYSSSGGTSGTTQPTWPGTPGGTVTDNGITWTTFRRGLIFKTALGGTSGATQPTWPVVYAGGAWGGFNYGSTVLDNTVTWAGGTFDNWSRFEVLFVPPLPASWANGLPAYSSDEVSRIRKVIRDWSPAFATCNRIVVAAVPNSGNWGVPNWGSFNYGAASVFGLQPAPWGAKGWGQFTFGNPVFGAGQPAEWASGAWGGFTYGASNSGTPAAWGSSPTVWQPV